jgi:hypothetical protein
MEGNNEAHTPAKRKIGHLKITRRALGCCAQLQLSGSLLQEDVLKLGNEIFAVFRSPQQRRGCKGILKWFSCSGMLWSRP